jgi:hypothetical protein
MAAIGKPSRILYFIRGAVPSTAQRQDAETYGFGVVFRNALHVPPDGALERCDFVIGDVPGRYQKAYPLATRTMQRTADDPAAPMAGPKTEAPAAAAGDSAAGATITNAPPATPIPQAQVPPAQPATPVPVAPTAPGPSFAKT